MYHRGDFVTITDKRDLSQHMFGMVVKVYGESAIFVVALDKGTFEERRFRTYNKLGIQDGKYIQFSKYNVYSNSKADMYYSKDYTQRILNRDDNLITYDIVTEYYEYFGGYTDFNGKSRECAYVYIKKAFKDKEEFSGGFITSKYGNSVNKNSLINHARARAEVNMYKQFAVESDIYGKQPEKIAS